MKKENIESIILDCFVSLKQKFYEEYKIEEYEEDTTPFVLSLRDIIKSLPPPSIKIIEILNEPKKYNQEKGFLIKYDYSIQIPTKIEFCGSFSSNYENIEQQIGQKFGFSEEQLSPMLKDIFSDFSNITVWEQDENWCVQFIKGDIVKEPKIFYNIWENWIFHFDDVPILSQKYRRQRFDDFNEIYGLKKEPIRPLSEIIKFAPQMEMFSFNLESLQESVAHIQLIPKVPKEINTVFKRAKKLFILGCFEYELFTISQHYAYLALEAAIKIRYIMSLNNNAVLTIPKKKLKHEINNPSYFDIVNFCLNNNEWRTNLLYVNEEQFPYNSTKLLDWLENNHLIRKWEKKIYKAGLDLRNYHSHLEEPSTTMPSAKLLHVIANEINYIFHKEITKT